MQVEYVNIMQGFMLVNYQGDNLVLPIVAMFDEYGDSTRDPEEASACMAGTEELGWLSVEVCLCGCHDVAVH